MIVDSIPVLLWIVVSGVSMSVISMAGAVTLGLSEKNLDRSLGPLVAFSAGALMGGAFLHLIPEAIAAAGAADGPMAWVLVGFTAFFLLEQYLHWRVAPEGEGDEHLHVPGHGHSHGFAHPEAPDARRPYTYLILIGDGVHNFIDGVAVAAAFLVDPTLGLVTWVAVAAHELPQELGDFGVLVHGGWSKRDALIFNALSSITFLLGGLLTYGLARAIDLTFLVPLAAGTFVYIAAADLIPEVKAHPGLGASATHFLAFVLGILLLGGIGAATHDDAHGDPGHGAVHREMDGDAHGAVPGDAHLAPRPLRDGGP